MLFVPIPHPLAGDKNNGVECYDGGDNEDDDDGDGDGDGGNDDDGDLADVQQAARCRLRRRHHKYGHVGVIGLSRLVCDNIDDPSAEPISTSGDVASAAADIGIRPFPPLTSHL